MSTCISHPKLKSSFPSERMVVIKSNLHEELKATTTRQGYCKKLFREFFKLPRDGNIFCEDTKSNSLTICCGIFNCKCYFAQRPLVLPAGHFQKIFYMFRPLLWSLWYKENSIFCSQLPSTALRLWVCVLMFFSVFVKCMPIYSSEWWEVKQSTTRRYWARVR